MKLWIFVLLIVCAILIFIASIVISVLVAIQQNCTSNNKENTTDISCIGMLSFNVDPLTLNAIAISDVIIVNPSLATFHEGLLIPSTSNVQLVVDPLYTSMIPQLSSEHVLMNNGIIYLITNSSLIVYKLEADEGHLMFPIQGEVLQMDKLEKVGCVIMIENHQRTRSLMIYRNDHHKCETVDVIQSVISFSILPSKDIDSEVDHILLQTIDGKLFLSDRRINHVTFVGQDIEEDVLQEYIIDSQLIYSSNQYSEVEVVCMTNRANVIINGNIITKDDDIHVNIKSFLIFSVLRISDETIVIVYVDDATNNVVNVIKIDKSLHIRNHHRCHVVLTNSVLAESTPFLLNFNLVVIPHVNDQSLSCILYDTSNNTFNIKDVVPIRTSLSLPTDAYDMIETSRNQLIFHIEPIFQKNQDQPDIEIEEKSPRFIDIHATLNNHSEFAGLMIVFQDIVTKSLLTSVRMKRDLMKLRFLVKE